MSTTTTNTLTAAELERAVRAADPAAVFVAPRVLRRLLRHDQGLDLFGWRVSRRRCLVIATTEALRRAEPDELGLTADPAAEVPSLLIVMARPDPEVLASQGAGDVLIDAWRLLFPARVRTALAGRRAAGGLTRAGLHARIDRIGQANFDEIRAVLRYEGLLREDHDLDAAYEEFAALYLELRHFEPRLLAAYFPSLTDLGAVDTVLKEDVDADALCAATRPAGAPGPETTLVDDHGLEPVPEPIEIEVPDLEEWFEDQSRRLRRVVREAERVQKLGNYVRAAILRLRVARGLSGQQQDRLRQLAVRAMRRMVDTLEPALQLSREEAGAWRRTLPALLDRAARGVWAPEARLLYDLQKVGVDHAREIHTIDLVEWALSLGRRPIKRRLPNHREVAKLRHLRSAAGRLRAVRVEDAVRERLGQLFEAAIHRVENQLRERFRPLVARTLERTQWIPQNVPERVALAKLIDDLLDPVVDHGFLSLGDLRDAVARNSIKLSDLSGPREFFKGDRLLRTDRRLAIALDGVYRSGEVYLRWLQRLSALAFGTSAGRLFTRYLALPFGGAAVALLGLQFLIEEVDEKLLHHKGLHVALDRPDYILVLGLLVMGTINFPRFRQGVWRVLKGLRRVFVTVLHDVPAWVLERPLVRRLLASRAFDLCLRWGIKPLVASGSITALASVSGALSRRGAVICGLATYTVTAVFLNSRLGRDVEEAAVDRGLRAGHWLRHDVIPGLFRLVMEAFERALELLERVIYTVDERLRFKTGQGQFNFVAKAVLGVIWFFMTYAIRIYINLLVEPTINPIKHFPVVTVAAKILLPIVPHLIVIVAQPFEPFLGKYLAGALAAANVVFLPGVFGFLVWELKENWRLYAANRSSVLRPVLVGHHGETIVRFLRPGIHSGTLPKLYAKLRRAERRRDRVSARKYRDGLHHAEAAIRRFADRELVVLLRTSREFADVPLASAEIRLGSNRIRISLERQDVTGIGSIVLGFEEQSGWLVAGVVEPGWLTRLSQTELRVFAAALSGFYKLAGVELVREQVESLLGATPPPYDIAEGGLIVWPDADYESEATYNLRNGPLLVPRATEDAPALPSFEADRVIFARRPLTWSRWVAVWEADQAGEPPPDPLLEDAPVLPSRTPVVATPFGDPHR
jgi:hypothetical protein